MTQRCYIKAQPLRKCRWSNTFANSPAPLKSNPRTLHNLPLSDQLRGERHIPRSVVNDAPGLHHDAEFLLSANVPERRPRCAARAPLGWSRLILLNYERTQLDRPVRAGRERPHSASTRVMSGWLLPLRLRRESRLRFQRTTSPPRLSSVSTVSFLARVGSVGLFPPEPRAD